MLRRFELRRTPLPPNVRLFNRILLVILATALLFQCGRCVFEPAAVDSSVEDSNEGPASIAPDSATEEEDDSFFGDEDDGPEDTITAPELAPEGLNGTPPHIARQKDPGLAQRIDNLLRANKPDHAFVLVVDSKTNEILAWGQRTDSAIATEPTFLKRTTFPAASLIKIVTAAAALETRRYGVNSELPNIGRAHTLYNNQLKPPANYKGPTISLAEAFAWSNNSVMGRIGLQLGGRTLGRIGNQLGFNRHYPDDRPHMSVFLPPDSGYALAEAASGFTKANTLSPLHAAAMVRAILQRKPLEIPWSKRMAADTFTVEEPSPIPGTMLSANTYFGLRQMFLRTVTDGTSRKAVRRTLYSYNREGLNIGGKTGSLDGTDPKGRYDWFAGFAEYKKDTDQSLVIIVMQVHGKYRSQSSTTVACQLINHWAKYNLNSNSSRKKN